MKFVCALCLLSETKFNSKFEMVEDENKKKDKIINVVQAEMEKVHKAIEKQNKEIEKLKEINDSKCKKEEMERSDFYQKITKNLNGFKNEFKKDEDEKKSYAKALLKNITKFEEHQDNVAAKMAKEVVNEARKSDYDRSQREKNVIVFGLKDNSEKKDDEKVIKDLFSFVGMKYDQVNFYRLGRQIDSTKERPVKVIFGDLNHKKKFLSQLYKLQKAPENLKSINVQHDLSPPERESLTKLLKKAREMNIDPKKPKEVTYKVRGPPFAFIIKKFIVKGKN